MSLVFEKVRHSLRDYKQKRERKRKAAGEVTLSSDMGKGGGLGHGKASMNMDAELTASVEQQDGAAELKTALLENNIAAEPKTLGHIGEGECCPYTLDNDAVLAASLESDGFAEPQTTDNFREDKSHSFLPNTEAKGIPPDLFLISNHNVSSRKMDTRTITNHPLWMHRRLPRLSV